MIKLNHEKVTEENNIKQKDTINMPILYKK